MPSLQDPNQLAEAIESLDRATNDFTDRLERIRTAVGPESSRPAPGNGNGHLNGHGATAPSDDFRITATPGPPAAEPITAPPAAAPAAAAPLSGMQQRFDAQANDVEAQASAYLAEAKHRADALVHSVMSAVEQEAAAMREETEMRIRERWSWVEFEAGRHVEEARVRADSLVREREGRITDLSGTITMLAESLSDKMADADRIRGQFAAFVEELSLAADRVVAEAHEAERAPAEASRLHRFGDAG